MPCRRKISGHRGSSFASSLFVSFLFDGRELILLSIIRFDLTIEYVKEFVSEWFDQNPLGQVSSLPFLERSSTLRSELTSTSSLLPQIGIIALRAGVAERLVEMGGTSPYPPKELSEDLSFAQLTLSFLRSFRLLSNRQSPGDPTSASGQEEAGTIR